MDDNDFRPLESVQYQRRLAALDAMGKGEIAARYALRCSDRRIVERAHELCVDAAQQMAENKFENRAHHLLKVCKQLKKHLDSLPEA